MALVLLFKEHPWKEMFIWSCISCNDCRFDLETEYSKVESNWYLRTFFDEIYLADPRIAEKLFEMTLRMHELLGIRVSSSKDHVIAPTRTLLALGIVMDFDQRVIYMPEGKVDKL